MSVAKRKKSDLLANLNAVVEGIGTFLDEPSLTIRGKKYTPEELQRVIRDHIDAMNAADAHHQQWLTMTQNLRTEFKQAIEPLVLAVEHLVVAKHGDQVDIVGAFGFKLPKKPHRSAENKKLAAEKARATRKARGTLGKRQRRAIHGVVPEAELAKLALPSPDPTKK